MSELPRLERADLQQALRDAYQRNRNHHLFAFYGTIEAAEPEPVEVTAQDGTTRTIRIVPVESELDLRMKLPAPEAEATPTAYLVPFRRDLPLDLIGRFAHEGHVRSIGNDARISRLFGVLEVDSETARSKLAPVVVREGFGKKLSEAKLRLPRLWSLWLDHRFGLTFDGDHLPLEGLLAWAAANNDGAEFASLPEATDLRKELLGLVDESRRDAAALVWAAWEKRLGREALAVAVLSQALSTGPNPWMRLRAKTLLGVETIADARLAELATAAQDALRRLERDHARKAAPTDKDAGRQARRRFLKYADGLVDDPEMRRAMASSGSLPLGWDARLAALGSALSELAAAPSVDRLRGVLAQRKSLEQHEQQLDREHAIVADRAQMAARLAYWLTIEDADKLAPSDTPQGPVKGLGRWYVEAGGYVDWARRVARCEGGSPFDAGVCAVVAAADARRQKLDRRFAKALVAWVDAGRPQDEALPIDAVLAKVVAPFLHESPDRKVLIVLLDGMAWAQALEIMESLGEYALPWGPIAHHTSLPLMLANLPTITEVSRAGFFGGKPVVSRKQHDTQADGDRFRDTPALVPYVDAQHPAKLLLKAESHTVAGDASQEAMSLVGDERQRVVGVVINVIDDSLKANTGQVQAWKVENVKSLRSLLEKAREAGRTVLFVSDHGHVPGDTLEYRSPGAPGGARWRPHRTGEPVQEDEVLVTSKDDRVWTQRGTDGTVLLADDRTRYIGAKHCGEHGGASLAEVVTPCFFIRWHEEHEQDRALAVRPMPVPSWWWLDAALLDETAAAPARPQPKKRKPTPAQLVMAVVIPPPPPPPEVVVSGPELGPIARGVRDSQLLAKLPGTKESRARVVDVVSFLEVRQGRANRNAFAAHMKAVPRLVPGLISIIQETVNLDGFQVLRFDYESQDVVLDLQTLRSLFEVQG